MEKNEKKKLSKQVKENELLNNQCKLYNKFSKFIKLIVKKNFNKNRMN